MATHDPERRGAPDARPFEGHIARELSRSRPSWPPRAVPPAGSPNVVVVLADDLGYSDIGCYGSEIPTPALDALAAGGLRYSGFHVAPSCSPTRAALLTGQNPHSVGFGFPAQFDPGFPGYSMELPDDVVTVAEAFRAAGYATMAVGKWHLAREADAGPGGSKASWPLQRGFDRYYGFLDGFTDYFAPHQLVEDNHLRSVERFPEDYYLTDDLTDAAVEMLRAQCAGRPGAPFFLYMAHGAVHAPLQARAADIARHLDVYGAGWDELRARRFDRQRALRIVPEGTHLPPPNHEPGNDVPRWAELDRDTRTLFARYMAVYAAMVESLDASVGRLVHELDVLGVRQDTLLLFLSDNGASREGGAQGTSAYLRTLHDPQSAGDVAADLAHLDEIGGPRAHAHYPRGWAMVSNTPFRLYKITTHAGAHQVPLVVSWPGHVRDPGAIRSGYHHVVDVMPTLLALAGVPLPTRRGAVPVRPLAGTSFGPTLDEADDARHAPQYYESLGNRGYYRDGYEIVSLHREGVPFDDAEWELYDLTADPTQTRDLAPSLPGLAAEMSRDWESAAWANGVFPLMDDFAMFSARPPSDDVFEQAVSILAGTPTLDRYRSAKLVQHRSFTVRVALTWTPGDHGVLVSHGGQGGGYLLWVEDDELVLTHRAAGNDRELRGGPIGPLTASLGMAVSARPGNRWSVQLLMDDVVLSGADGWEGFVGMAPLQGIDVGLSRGSPVSWPLFEREGSFEWTGSLDRATYTPGPLVPDAPELLVQQRLAQRWE